MVFKIKVKTRLFILFINAICSSMEPLRETPQNYIPTSLEPLVRIAVAAPYMQIASEVKLSCPECSYTASTNWTLKNHRAMHRQNYKFKCEKCDYKTSYGFNYTRHLNSLKHKTKS